MRRLFAFAAVVSLAISAFPGNVLAFVDAEKTRYNEGMEYLKEKGILQGFPGDTSRPFQLVTRAEALKIILMMRAEDRALVEQVRASLPPMALFWDIDQKDWYAPYVEAGFQRKLITGYPDGSFRPHEPIKVQEAVSMLMRAYGISDETKPPRQSQTIDNPGDQWFTPYLNAAIVRELFSKKEFLRVGYYVTRGQFSDIAYRMHVVDAEELTAFNRPEWEPPTPPPVQVVYTNPQPRPTTTTPRTTTSTTPTPTRTTTTRGTTNRTTTASSQGFYIDIPKLGIEKLRVIHPSDPFTSQGILAPLQSGVGHLFSYPGGGGTVFIYGHSSGYPWDVSQFTKIFRRVNELNVGDKVYVSYNGRQYAYQVTREETIPAGQVGPFSSGSEELILYTCWPPDSISSRYLIHAKPIDVAGN